MSVLDLPSDTRGGCNTAAARAVLETRRIVLREFRRGDEADLIALHRDERVTALLLDEIFDTPVRASTFIFWVRRIYAKHPGMGVFHASDKADGRFVGYFSFMPLPGGGDVELGARLSPRVWGRRYAVEGGRALIAYGFETLALPRIVSVFHPDNRPVRFVLRQLGFRAAPTPETLARGVERHALERSQWSIADSIRVSPTCGASVPAVSWGYETAIQTVGVAP